MPHAAGFQQRFLDCDFLVQSDVELPFAAHGRGQFREVHLEPFVARQADGLNSLSIWPRWFDQIDLERGRFDGAQHRRAL